MAEPALRLSGLVKRFGDTAAVDGLDLDVAPGELVTLLGPSGCGKTTTLNLIAGFSEPDGGSIRLEGRPIEDLPPWRRELGMVFQDYALFPHMNVAENVGYGLRTRRMPSVEIKQRVGEALELVKLAGLGARRPAQLSGGQRQRVALARALVIRPKVLLLDEPLSNLDLKLREEMRLEILSLQRQLAMTTVFVTHDQGEALVMSDRIAVMNRGRIEQVAAPAEIYERPASAFVASFIGTTNMLAAQVLSRADGAGRAKVRLAGAELVLRVPAGVGAGAELHLTIRPERLRLGTDGDLMLLGRVAHVAYLGPRLELRVTLAAGATAIVDLPNDGRQPVPAPGAEVTLTASGADCWLLER